MDGGERLARSLRQLGFAALGLSRIVLSYLPSRKPAPRRLPPPRDDLVGRLVATLERRLPRGIGSVATILILLSSAIVGVVKGNHVDEITTALSDARDAVSNTV